MDITKEQFGEWKEHPITKEIFKEIEILKKGLLEQLGTGSTIGYDAAETHGRTSKVVGQIDGLNQLLNIDFADNPDTKE